MEAKIFTNRSVNFDEKMCYFYISLYRLVPLTILAKKKFKRLFFYLANLVRPNLPNVLIKKFGKDGLTKFAKIIRRNFHGKIGQTIVATENAKKFWRIWSGVR